LWYPFFIGMSSLVIIWLSYRVGYADSFFHHIRDTTDRLENDIQDSIKWDNFELLEHLPITVSGVEGELIACVVDWFLPFAPGDGPKLRYFGAVYFADDDLIRSR